MVPGPAVFEKDLQVSSFGNFVGDFIESTPNKIRGVQLAQRRARQQNITMLSPHTTSSAGAWTPPIPRAP